MTEEIVNLKNPVAKAEVANFLLGFGLGYDEDVDYTVVLREGRQLVATCSKAKDVLKCFAVSEAHQGEGISATLMTALINRLFEEGIRHYFVFTMPDKVVFFENLGFRLLYKGKAAALMEGGMGSIEETLKTMATEIGFASDRSALVMNCNPFTLGHLYVIEKAAAASGQVMVFVVEEDRSVFRFKDRIEMVRRGTAHLKNVLVLPGTEYIISSTTFPSYFLRQQNEKTEAFMELDAGIFCDYFCKVLGIASRYVGSEPYCDMSCVYNGVLGSVFETHGIKLHVIERMTEDGEAVSASRVRQLIREDRLSDIQRLVPPSTYDYLVTTQAGMEAVERIKTTNTPH